MSAPGDSVPDYKSTLHLPQTDFPMKGNLPTKEPEIIKFWEEKKIYEKMISKNRGRKSFVMPDGPPYANGPIHIGHSLNKTLKDIVIKYQNMAGACAAFIPGWDCHGLPIEHKVMKDLEAKKTTATDNEIRKLCRAEAQKWVDIQRDQFRRLGILAEWQKPYLTMDKEYEAEEVREFARAYERGTIYRGEKPVYWNWYLKTALADAEVEYHMHKSPAVYVKFPVKDPATLKRLQVTGDVSFVIWTTTPWTLPANLGISLHPDFDYGIYGSEKGRLIIATGLKESFEKDTQIALTLERTFKGRELDRGLARHPFIERDSLIMLGQHVTADAGTGAVHTAPGHGLDDYRVGLQYGLEILSPVNESGLFTDDVADFKGLHIFKANPLVVEKLKSLDMLLGHREIEHSYPHCWRSKVPLIYRSTPQWFIGLDNPKTKLRELALKTVAAIDFYPAWGEARFKAMMENRPDWCLSRQRIWGVPIPIFYCKATGEPLLDSKIMLKVADVLEKEDGIDAFYRHDPEFFIGPFTAKGEFGSQGFRHGRDILDVWFDSGVCHAAVQRRRGDMAVPADIYLEGSDQHRGWFNTSLLSALATTGESPYKALITHGFVNDSDGKKMSKSKGNSVDPQEVSSKSGAEILRLWSVYEDYGQDLTCGKDELTRVTETYRRIRNTVRFLLGSIGDFDPRTQQVPYEKMTVLDQWALHRLSILIQKVTEAYNEFEFYKVYHLFNQFFTVELSAVYLDVLKDRLYTWKTDGLARRSSQTGLYIITEHLLRMLAPVLSFLAEEAYGFLPGEKKESVFLCEFPEAPKVWARPDLEGDFAKLLEVRTTLAKDLEGLRTQKTIGSSLDAQVELSESGETFKILKKYEPNLREFFIVSSLKLNEGESKVNAQRAQGEKCVRCWHYDLKTGASPRFPGVCPKCVEALS